MGVDLDAGQLVITPIRSGMKREFRMLIKAQSEIGELPLGPRRVTRSRSAIKSSKTNGGNGYEIGEKLEGLESKRKKKAKGEDEMVVIEGDIGVDLNVLKVDRVAAMTAPGGEGEGVESALAHVVNKVVEFGGENEKTVGGVSDSGSEVIGEAMCGLSEKCTESDAGGEESEGNGVLTGSSPMKLEMKMSKKVGLRKVPTKLKDLLETGLLEGLNVRYIRGSKSRMRPGSELPGVIRGTGVLCSCSECNGDKVITPDQFELHARSGNNCPPEYMYLENGNRLRDVLNACRIQQSESLELVILKAIGRSDSKTAAFCLSCKGLLTEDGAGRPMLLCDSCISKEAGSSFAQIIDVPPRSLVADSPAPVASPSPGQPGVSESGPNSQTQGKHQGRLTKKDLGMHRIVFTEDFLPDGAALYYMLHGERKIEGYKKDGAIFCLHCGNVVSPSQFEAHAGFASRRKPYDNIFTSNGMSLHTFSLQLSMERKPGVNDDLCSICFDGGDLICCDKCPRSFHTECVGLLSIPEGTWYCRYCTNMIEKAKAEANSANAKAAGRVAGVDPFEEITRRCIRIVDITATEKGGCAICRSHDFTKKKFDDRTVIICDQCEKDYHVGCLRDEKMDDLKALPEGDWFCSKPCSTIHSTLSRLIGVGDQKLPEALSNIVKKKKKNEEQDTEQNHNLNLKWRLLKGNGGSTATRKLLAEAVSIFHNRFDPIADFTTSNLDLIPHLVYGRPFKGQDHRGMYCAILLDNNAVVSAAIFRVFGDEVAEIPLVATKSDCQGKGYFQSLFFCIENLLASLNVKDFVLPAADEAESLWKNKFGFVKLEQEKVERYKELYHQMMIFQETSMLHKLIPDSEVKT